LSKTYYYTSYETDFVKSKNQDYKLSDNYKYIHNNIFYKVLSYIVYFIVIILSLIYSKLILHVSIKNKKILRHERGYFIYANHTQILGDVLNPFLFNYHHPYIICSSSNLGIPFIGKIIPIAGALPIPESLSKSKEFIDSIIYHNKKNHPIVIYPEAHLWPYATLIRPFPNTSFDFPVRCNSKVFTATTTYQKSKFFKKPKITIYIDGPFTTINTLTKKENKELLHDKVYNIMQERSKSNNYSYINYEQEKEKI
jgi:1-acyl-sn-glycerol-3-phosphate acyltransferase